VASAPLARTKLDQDEEEAVDIIGHSSSREGKILPPQDLAAAMDWPSKLPCPWCNSPLSVRGATIMESLGPMIHYLGEVQGDDG
jgi:hypothetical protein